MAKSLSLGIVKRIAFELKKLESDSIEGIVVKYDPQNISIVYAYIQGPVSTPYEGGTFKVKLNFTPDYPSVPPVGYFVTKIFHPNVSKDGQICVNTLKKDWKPELDIRHILLVIRCLLIDPNAESALNEEAGKLLLEKYEEFAKHAKLWTEIYASIENKASNIENIRSLNDCQNTLEAATSKKESKRSSLKRL
ncbi:ubiquitin-conjugating enzyme E2 [Galdieria sulphuraria]|uniref:E2 ubiquitin-conjugating enzyme n=1 Tax=Galdieria sulphuraria TaxID=130081 RepID=M2XZM3_GALSU|nr:ubiquitin-conjugating enzyme E2 [Galdieria sulphuraria]EME29098.1 ubiquitin-conjugating enzyme E2 [Galdieria sulphuraria]|eukprot:XP_005705618.1 ubiquitin-conjugating enzyme E2 [Galdieria sulphuraria]